MASWRWTAPPRVVLRVIAAVLMVLCLGVGTDRLAYAEGGKQTASSLIKKGQDLFDEQLYEESIQTLSAALMRPGIAKDEKIEVYRLLAYNYITLQRTEEADGAVRGLLVLDPTFELPDGESPRFRDFFKQVRAKWEEEGKPGAETASGATATGSSVLIKHASPAQVDAGLAVSLTGTVDDPKAVVQRLKLYYRASADEKFATARAKYGMRKFTAEIPADVVEPPLVEYYFEALDENGLPVASRGDAESPLRIAVPDEGAWYTSPWFWVPVTTVVAGAVVVGIVLGTAGTPTSQVTVNVFD
jgi:hypothetical protein